ncbi:MAG: hypothetical protein DDT26_02276 [Dehalococcoidia bacterium]|nr:hypothetical protein [Chloroflexota bacterium]
MKEDIQHDLSETLVLRQIAENEWEFEYARLTRREWDRFYDILDLWNSGCRGSISKSERGYRQLLSDYPEFIDVYHHLAILLDETGRPQEAFHLWEKAVNLGLSCFPQNFSMGQDRLPWAFLDNRPFLRAYKAFGLALMEQDKVKNTLTIFTNILSLNPNDNQGVRSLAINCNFILERPWEVLGISQQYPEDIMSEVIYGRVLALYQLGLKAEAKTALGEAVEYLPLVAKELIKKRHTRPKEF